MTQPNNERKVDNAVVERLPSNAAASKANAVAVSLNAICESHRKAYGDSPGLMTSIGIKFLEAVRDEIEELGEQDKEIGTLKAQLAAVMAERDQCKNQHEHLVSVMRDVALKAEEAEQLESWLEDIGKQIGCGHVDEALPSCVGHILEKLTAERDQLQSQHVQLMRAYDPNCDEYHFDEQLQTMKSARRIVDAMQDLAEGLGRDPEGNLSDIDDEALGRIQDLEAERDQLAEKVASDAEDAEVGRLVRSIVGQDTDILRIYHWADGEYEYVDETHEGNEEGYTCNEQWGDTLLEALQALSQGGEA